GAYAYTLHQNGIIDPADGDWYLRSTLEEEPGVPGVPGPGEPSLPEGSRYAATVPLYEAYPQVLQALNGLPTLQQRVGNRYWPELLVEGTGTTSGGATEQNGIWSRIEGSHTRFEPNRSTSSTNYDLDLFRMQAGFDGMLYESEAGRLLGGLTVHYGHASADVSSFFGDGDINTNGYGFGGTLTWYGDNGVYVDGQAQLTWYDSNLTSRADDITQPRLVRGNDGFGYALSVEGGKRIALEDGWSVTPQAQLVYSEVDFNSFRDAYGADVGLDRGDSLQGRLGLRIERQNAWSNDNRLINRTSLYGIGNLYYEFLDGTKVAVAGETFASRNDRLWGGVGIGASYNWDN
ncbi:autotransporter outer membrane beta-barrel domain-containing protein, partial [Neorhizobium sp. T786]|uniref:autotransporter family protein n=1 Tax=Pseudorhizobium xiangyangii TaxID=2883104 RepID=UPI001CFFFD53